jgi:hypothetical protein
MVKAILFMQLPLLVFMAYSCRNESSKLPASSQAVSQPDSVRIIVFEKDIVPILQAKCSPCHFEGGKMYVRMPFDKSQTILDHTESILKRFQEPQLTQLKAYLAQAK